ncbi:hypothetical protein MaudCBS49596_000426 [Microsporum audouinii]
MARSESDKEMLRQTANKLIAGDETVQISSDETTGENDFKFEKWPNVCAVVIDKGSGFGFVQVSGGGGTVRMVHTGRGEPGYVKLDIADGQSCMLYGQPTVLYIHTRAR